MADFSSKASELLWDTHIQLLKLTVLKETEQNLCHLDKGNQAKSNKHSMIEKCCTA